MKVILISGKAQNGKDTVANKLKEDLEKDGQRVLIAHFASAVKNVCRDMFGWDSKKDQCGRTLLQYVGTDKVRKMFPDFWIDYLKKLLEVFYDLWDYVIIPDCRFKNEIDSFLHDDKFQVLTVNVKRTVEFENNLTAKQRLHESETNLENYHFDCSIYNDKGLNELMDKVSDLSKVINIFFDKE